MKLSLNWVKEYTDVKLSVDELVTKIGAQLGAVEEVIDIGKKYQGIVIAKVVSCEKHPDADKLSVCKIDDGGVVKGVKRDEKGLIQVVCGAPNVRSGQLVAWLPPGVVVPATYDKEPFKLETREIRGEMSNGMIASAHELALSEDHAGILEIDNPGVAGHKDPSVDMNDHVKAFQNIVFSRRLKPGDDFAKAFGLDDYIIDIENKMFTHRPDLFGILGLAREVAGISHQSFKSPKWYLQDKSSGEMPADKQLLKIHNELPKLVPRFMAQVVQNVEVRSSSVEIQTKLARVGIRPINNIVDITNYVMYLTGQPLHAYDYDKVLAQDPGAKNATLTIRHPKKGEKIKLLNGKEIEPYEKAIMIASATKLIGVGGVMGGADTEVDASTKNIILEAANFDMYAIRKTAMEEGLFTDAVTRFTKGQSLLQTDRALALAMDTVVHESGGTPASSVYDVHKSLSSSGSVRVSPAFINERLGLSLSPKKIVELLENVEFKILQSAGKQLAISPPFWRTDIEIPEDIVEEVGRLYGYDHLPIELPKRTVKPIDRNELFDFKARIRNILSRAGASEVLTYSFVHGDLLEKVGQDPDKAFQLSNAISPDLQYYRLSLMPSLLDKVHGNLKSGIDEFAIFELGKGHNKDQIEEKLPKEFEMLALAFAVSEKKTSDYAGASFYEARYYLDYLARELGLQLTYKVIEKEEDYPVSKPYNHLRSASVWAGDIPLGMVGEFRASVTKNLKLPSFAAGFEIGIEQLITVAKKTQPYHVLSRFPKVTQDITLKVSNDISYSELYKLVEGELDNARPQNSQASLEPLDIYQQDSDGPKHITLRLTIASYERTLKAEEVNNLLNDITNHARETLGAERL